MTGNNPIYTYLMENVDIEGAIKFFILYFFIVWIAILVWVIRDITNRTDNVFLQLFAILSILVLTPLGVFIYLIIRPSKTLFEKYYDEVENNLDCLSDEIKGNVGPQHFEKISCFACGKDVEKDFKYCANCNVKLLKKCRKCNKDQKIEWKNCPYCGTDDKNKADKEKINKNNKPKKKLIAKNNKKNNTA